MAPISLYKNFVQQLFWVADTCMAACFSPVSDFWVMTMAIFLDIDISKGRTTTYLRCGVIFNNDFIANLLLSLSLKGFWKSVSISQSYGQSIVAPFCDSQCIYRFTSDIKTQSLQNCWDWNQSLWLLWRVDY